MNALLLAGALGWRASNTKKHADRVIAAQTAQHAYTWGQSQGELAALTELQTGKRVELTYWHTWPLSARQGFTDAYRLTMARNGRVV
jgi:hypothetical protein